MGPDAFMPIRAYDVLVEAELARALLDGHGIETRLSDQHTVAAASYLSQSLGGVKVLVRNGQRELAEEILQGLASQILMQERPVFRVKSPRWGRGVLAGSCMGLVLALLLPGAPVGALVVVAMGAGAGLGLLGSGRDGRCYCSNSACIAPFDAETTHCPTCQRPFSGTIAHMDERLGAEEAWMQRGDARA
jgi:hypothetical protein